jgi:nucleolar protein 56
MVEPNSSNKIYLVETLIGVFGVTEDNEIVEVALFPKDPKKISAALDRHSSGEVSKELREAIEKLVQRGFKKFVFTNKGLAETLRKKYRLEINVVDSSGADDFIRENLEALGIEYGLFDDASQFYSLSQEIITLKARKSVQKAQSERSVIINQTVQLLNELDKTLNTLSNKLIEWYGVHFPELSRYIENHKTYTQIVLKFGYRINIEAEGLKELGIEKSAKTIQALAQSSMGAYLAPEDIGQIKQLANHLLYLYEYRPEVESYLASTATEVAPNLSIVAGPVLAAKLIEKAGNLKKLAMMPSGTIQLLGAEKALFRSKKTRAKPPKHGLIFQHPFVHSKSRKLRGRSARNLASKLALAARADFFSGNPIGDMLKRQLEE